MMMRGLVHGFLALAWPGQCHSTMLARTKCIFHYGGIRRAAAHCRLRGRCAPQPATQRRSADALHQPSTRSAIYGGGLFCEDSDTHTCREVLLAPLAAAPLGCSATGLQCCKVSRTGPLAVWRPQTCASTAKPAGRRGCNGLLLTLGHWHLVLSKGAGSI